MSVSKLGQYVLKILLILASVSLLAMMLVISLNVIGRIFFSSPILGALEIAGLAGVIFIAIALGFTEKEKNNVVVEVLVMLLSPRRRAVTDAVTLFLSLIGVAFLSYAVIKDAFHSAEFNEQTLVLGISTSPFKFIWAAGTLMLFLFILKNMITALRKVLNK